MHARDQLTDTDVCDITSVAIGRIHAMHAMLRHRNFNNKRILLK